MVLSFPDVSARVTSWPLPPEIPEFRCRCSVRDRCGLWPDYGNTVNQTTSSVYWILNPEYGIHVYTRGWGVVHSSFVFTAELPYATPMRCLVGSARSGSDRCGATPAAERHHTDRVARVSTVVEREPPGRRDRTQKRAVVTGDNHRALVAIQCCAQLFHTRVIEVVARFIEQQQLWCRLSQ